MSMLQTSVLDREAFEKVLSIYSELGLVSAREQTQVLSLLDEDFEFAETIRLADSVHMHVEVERVGDLPDEEIQRLGVSSISRYSGPDMVKYSYAGGIGVIFSSFTIAQDDLIKGGPKRPKPYVDHIGIDLRNESAVTRAAFDAIPERATGVGWRHVHQAAPLYCCYVAVGEKHWVYPPEGAAGGRRPIEFAFGELRKFDTNMGCDYRPIDPAHPLAGTLPTRTMDCNCECG